MQTHFVATPFGRRAMSLGMIASQAAARDIPAGTRTNKWEVFRHIREARDLIGATDRGLAILNALLSFHPETELAGDGELVVWPSNEQLMARANGMPATTLRRHIAILVDCGLIIRRDSPNGKRFARKGRDGEIQQAYGFDLSPVLARAAEFGALAESVQAEKKALRVARERLTLLRRDIVKMIDTAIEEKVPGNWGRVLLTYQEIISRLPRNAGRLVVEDAATDLHGLWTELREVLESFAKTQIPAANESHSGRHIQNSKPDSNLESTSTEKRKLAAAVDPTTNNVHVLPERELPLTIVLDACPTIGWLAKGGEPIRSWRELLAAAEIARSTLGVSPSAWEEARTAMGDKQAAITIAGIYQRSEQISSAGGYLRSLTDKAREGKYSALPMIMALLRARLDDARIRDGGGGEGASPKNEVPQSSSRPLEISEALKRSFGKPKGSA